ncbi:MAG: MGMT family protein [Metallibacterium scheffleri]
MGTESGSLAAHAAIHAAIRAVPAGRVSSYGAIAARAGLRGRARLVGRVLREGATPALPWHRVLHSDGRLAAPPGTALAREQMRRLAAEGVPVHKGRVAREYFIDGGDLDALLWRG